MRFRQALVYGGVGQGEQIKALRRGVDVLVATPGRLLDLMDQGHVDLSDIEIFVLDEADRMLDMGFMPALKRIIATLPRQRQSLFFSATLPPKIRELAARLLFNPVSVTVTGRSTTVERIEQSVRFGYVHRIGRTARAGADGIAISFCTADEMDELRAIERLIGANLQVENPELRPESGRAAGKDQVSPRKSNRGRRARTLQSESRTGTQRRFRRVNKKHGLARANKRQRSAIAWLAIEQSVPNT